MKKMLKAAAVLAAAMMVMGFASCSNGDDAEDLGTLLLIKDAQEKAEAAAKENTSSSSAAENESKVAETYTLDISKIPETIGTTNKLDDTVTVISTKTSSKGVAQTIKYSEGGKYVQMSGAGVDKNYGLQLTLTGAATIKVKATKKVSGSATAVKLINTDGSEKGKTSGIDENGATSLTEYPISVDAAGTYIIGADSNGCFLFSLVIEYK